MTAFGCFLLAAIQLSGVVSGNLRARSFFDANNVKVGDPLKLTIDFIGEADFRELHPPALSKAVDPTDWKLDDISAKTDTFRDGRRLVYRVRPMRKGLLWFPSLAFEYAGKNGEKRQVVANAIPVHAKVGAQVVVDGMDEDQNKMPQPDPIVTALPASCADDGDLAFAWRKACARPSADAFAAFDFPEAKLNEAALAIQDGNWARALKLYRWLEWRIGQTPSVERGIVAALALRYDNPRVELPVWRQVGRPLLRYGWQGRVGLVVGTLTVLALVFWLVGRGIRAVACVGALLLFTIPASGQGLFERMEEQMRQMQQRMNQAMGFSLGGESRAPVKVEATVKAEPESPQVGEPFNFIISLDAPKSCSIGQVSLQPSERFGFALTDRPRSLDEVPSANPSNVIRRLAVPVRYDVPFKGKLSFSIDGMITGRESRHGGRFSFTYSNSFQCETLPIDIEIRPLSTLDQPKDFSGIIADRMTLTELPDLIAVETNDVVTLTYRLRTDGYVPDGYLPEGAAFEWTKDNDAGIIEYKRFFVADGTSQTPRLKIVYYAPATKSYHAVTAGGTVLKYGTSN